MVVRPWKLLSKTRISPCAAGTPLTVCPHLRASLMAVSTASAPLFIGRKRSKPVSALISWQSCPSWSLRKAREQRVSRSACSVSRFTRRGWQCPWLTAE